MLRGFAAITAIVFFLVGCSPEESADAPTEEGPLPEVNLPPVPEIDIDRPVEYPDGSLSVFGLSLRTPELFTQNVRVTGYVDEVYICEFRPQMEASDRAIRYRRYMTEEEYTTGVAEGTGFDERCQYPHLYVTDSLGSERRLLITGYEAPMEPLFLVGDRLVFEGRFVEETRGINRAGAGLIFVTSITREDGAQLDAVVVDELGAPTGSVGN